MNPEHIRRLIKTAKRSFCNQKVAALGLSRRGDFVAACSNSVRYIFKGGGIHAEMKLMRKHGTSIRTIILCRVNVTGELLPIHPCAVCSKVAKDLGIKIISVYDEDKLDLMRNDA